MTKSKKDRLQRQTSEKLQARATTIIPIHRESIVRPDQGTIVPTPSGTMPRSASGTGTPGDQFPPQKERWMTKFCVEPPGGDCRACCMGMYVPYALYGKVNWRLQQKSLGKDIDDWSSSKGCNGPCWAYWALMIPSGGIVAGVFAGLQRSQIRGTYGIGGNCAADIAMGIFLPQCVLMQNDREVRAREGHDHLIYNDKYEVPRPSRRSSMVDEQPRRKPQMVAPGVFPLRRKRSPAQMSDESIPMTPIDNDAASHTGGCRDCPHMRGQGAQIVKDIPGTLGVQGGQIVQGTQGTLGGDAKTPAPSPRTQPANQKYPAKMSELVVDKKRRQAPDAMPIVVVTGPEDSSRAARPPCPVHGLRHDPKILNRGADRLASSNDTSSVQPSREHALVECSTLEMTDCQLVQETQSPEDSTYIEEIQNRRLDSHALSDCSPTIEPTPVPTEVVQQHALAECSNTPPAPPEVQELSYVHDFTDCPGKALEYYKKGAKKPQPHDFAHCAGQNSTSNATSGNGIQEHGLEDCPARSSGGRDDTNNGTPHEHPAVRQHLLSDSLTNNSPSTDVETSELNVGSGSGTSGSRRVEQESQTRGKTDNKGKGKAKGNENENAERHESKGRFEQD